MIHDLSEATKHWLDVGAFAGFVVAGFSLASAALIVTMLAGACSVIWFLIRVHDRIKYGPSGQ